MTCKTPAMVLQELSTKECGQGPNYHLITQQQGTHENIFEYIVDVLGIRATGKGRSKKEAKQDTAKNALLKLNEVCKVECMPPNLAQPSQQVSPDDVELRKVVNYIGELDDICLINDLPQPVYDLIFDSGPPHQKIFTYECRLGHSIIERSTSSTKKQARQNVAKQILERIEGIVPALVKEHSTELLELCDSDTEAVNRHKELTFLKRPNYKIKIGDYHQHLQLYLQEKDISIGDIKEYFEKPHSEENLQQLLEKIELKYDFEDLTEEDNKNHIVGCSLSTSVPLCTLGIGDTKKSAREMAINVIFRQIMFLLRIPDD